MANPFVYSIFAVSFLFGSIGEKVIVTDEDGRPVQGAKVYALSLSVNSGPTETNAKGEASIPSNVQGTKWILITKSGYKELQAAMPDEWPLRLTLERPK